MCSLCKDSDPKLDRIRLARQGAVEVDDFDKEVNYTPKTKEKKRSRGCPENDNGPHIYFWDNYMPPYRNIYGMTVQYLVNVCCGCGKRKRNKLILRRIVREKD